MDFRDKEVEHMWKMRWLLMSAVLAVLVSGCGKSAGTGASSTAPGGGDANAGAVTESGAQLEGPAAAVQEFLEALRTGNDEKAATMLSAVARQKTASLNRNVTPPASDTARFAIGKVEYINDDGARVACTWTDLDEEGQPKTDEAIWVLRREQEAWRVAGVAAQVFPGEPPLLLNFEDPEDMFRKQQWVREEIRRRIEAGDLQAQGGEKQEKSIRR
jgi:hypothetical protein